MRVPLLLILALAPSAALADMTAVYGAPNSSFSMKIEIASNGDLRGYVSAKPGDPRVTVKGPVGPQGMSFITRSGQGYFIQADPSGPIVTRVEDMATVMAEQMQQMPPEFRDAMRQMPAMHIVPKAQVTINGRVGTAYHVQFGKSGLSPQPWAVISDDPALKPLADAMARQMDMSVTVMEKAGTARPFAEIQSILHGGAPLMFGGAELQSVRFDPIPPSEFELPAAPESLEHLRVRMAHPPAPVGETPADH
jgi:hypothetical protein